jgi:hypothetical protein
LKFGPFPPAPKTARFSLIYQATGGPRATNHFYMRYTNSLSSADALTLLTTLAGSWNTRMASLTVPNWTLVQTAVNDLDSRTGIESGLVVSHPGTSAGNTLGAAVSFVLSFKTALKYRGGHSRVYVPGISAASESDVNSWSPTGQGNVFTAFTGMINDLTTSPPVGVGALSQVVVRYISSNKADFTPAPPTTPPPWLLPTPMVLPVTATVTNPQFASQRRRNQQ